MARTIVPEEETRAVDLTDLKDNVRPTDNRKVLVESDADTISNLFWWDAGAEASNADGVTTVESNITEFADGGANEGLWKRTVKPIEASTTDDLSEGSTNLYYTDERVDDRVDQLLQAGSNINLTYDDAANTLTIDAVGTSTDISEDGSTVVSNTTDINFTAGFDVTDDGDGTGTVDMNLSEKSTDDLPEGSTNLYYTDERVDDRVDQLLIGGTNVDLTYDDANDTLTIDVSEENIQDSVYNNVLSGTQTLITVTYDDANNEVDYVVESDLSQYDFSNVTTDDIAEGSTNLYYTDERVDDEVDQLLQAGSNINLTYDDAANTLTIDAVGTSTDVSEDGTTVVSNTTDINFTAGFDVIDDGDGTTTVDMDLSEKSTDDLPEGSTNLYYTDERAQDATLGNVSGSQGIIWTYDDAGNSATVTLDNLNSFTTDDLAEGSTNLYFTDERVDDRVDQLLVGGTNINLVYDDAANTLTINTDDVTVDISEDGSTVLADIGDINFTAGFDVTDDGDGTATVDMNLSEKTTDDLPEGSTNLYYTDERAQDAAATMITGGTNITTSYDDANDTFTIDNDVRFGSATFSGNRPKKEFQIPHGLGSKPTSWTVQPVTDDASALSHATADATNITIVYDTSPPNGTDNIVVNYSLLI